MRFGGYLWLCPLWRGRLGCEKVVSLQLIVMVEIRVGGGGEECLIVYAVESSFLVYLLVKVGDFYFYWQWRGDPCVAL